MEWDTAAGDAVLRAAGGSTSTLDGKPLAYGKRNQAHDADFANPHFVARGGASLPLEGRSIREADRGGVGQGSARPW